jgi:small nuclear ribonucleoprotein (snRNP)-like protein
MDPEQAAFWLSQLIGKTLRIHASDGRVFVGTFKCTDKDRNVILALAYEYRAPPAAAVRQAVEDAGDATAVPWDSRYVGLVVVPGQHVRKIELEESLHPGMKSGVIL